MRLVTYRSGVEAVFGAVLNDRIVDLKAASTLLSSADSSLIPLPGDMEAFLADTPRYDGAARRVLEILGGSPDQLSQVSVALDGLQLLPPTSRPTKIVCVARNYAEHAREAGLELPTIPILFPRFAATLIGDHAPIAAPALSPQLDWEGELALIVGRSTNGRITKAEALDYVYGYTIFNDVTVRDFQFRVNQYTGGKNFRRSGPLGPWLVTADEFGDPHSKQITTRLNGEVMQSANTSTMIFDVPTILQHIAEFIDLEAGDVIPTGTPAGVGFKRNPPIFLKDGDTVEVEVEGIGILTNPVMDEGKIR